MKAAIIGNNDGPLVLIRALKRAGSTPVLIALQNPVEPDLFKEYEKLSGDAPVITGFDEAELIARLEDDGIDVVINCFSNILFHLYLQLRHLNHFHPTP